MVKKNTNISPYYDDFDENKKFHRILYRPKYAIQAREANQMQTILQNQVERFGSHVFKNGAMVIPGQITYNNTVHFVKVLTDYSGSPIDYEAMVGGTITNSVGVKGKVIHSVGEETNASGGTDPVTLFIAYEEPGSGGETIFDASEELTVDTDAGQHLCTTIPSGPGVVISGRSSMSWIEAGVYFIDGFFVSVDAQKIVLEKYDNTPSYRVGLLKSSIFITSNDDNSLTDNAQGYPNYAAPGADRLKIELTLSKVGLNSSEDENFIELHRIENGVLIAEVRVSAYSELNKTLARRTYDESGDYTVDPFICTIQEYFKDQNLPLYKNGKYTTGNGPNGESDSEMKAKLLFHLDPGKAYVRGFEINTIATSDLVANKARTTDTKYNEIIFTELGNYIILSGTTANHPDGTVSNYTAVTGIPELEVGANNFEEIDLYAEPIEATQTTVIGTANVKYLYKYGSNYILGIFNISMNQGQQFSDVRSVASGETGSLQADVVLDPNTLSALVYETNTNNLLYPLQQKYVKGTLTSTLTYSVLRMYRNQLVSVGTSVSLTSSPGELYNTSTGLIYIVDQDNGDAIVSDAVYTIGENGTELTISNLVNGHTYDIFVPVIKTARPRTKTFNKNYTTGLTALTDNGDSIPLGSLYDVFRLVSVVDNTTGRDITDRYIFDDGQRDNFYQISTIKRKKGVEAPQGTLTVTVDWFQWGGSGDYFTANSYILSSNFGYEDIPTYRGTRLSDVVDFRPASSGLDTSNSEIPLRNNYIACSYDFYIGRIDYITLNSDGEFSIVEGEASEFPQPPKVPDNAMPLYEVRMSPYTVDKYHAELRFIENKRYTMKDIGRLENRINNLEYYATLNMLEKETNTLQILDDAGFDRFKNGFIVDPFTSHGIGDIYKSDYRCSIDRLKGLCRPKFVSKSCGLEFNADCASNSTGYAHTGSLITLDFDEVSFISQPYASRIENVNPHSVRLYKGTIEFNPSSDNWYDTEKSGEFIINNDANYAALEFIASNGEGLDGVAWDAWETDWISRSSSSNTSTSGSTSKVTDRSREHWNGQGSPPTTESGVGWVGVTNNTTRTTTTITTTKEGQSRDGIETWHSPQVINRDAGDRTVGINYIPYMREIYVSGYATGLKPNTRVYPYFDNEPVTDVVSPNGEIVYTASSSIIDNGTSHWQKQLHHKQIYGKTSGATSFIRNVDASTNTIYVSIGEGTFVAGENIHLVDDDEWVATVSSFDNSPDFGDPLYTDSKGTLAFLFHIVSGTWRTGERKFKLIDQPIDVEESNTSAYGVFISEGSLLQTEGTVLSTRTIGFSQRPLEEERVLTSTAVSTRTRSSSSTVWYDPIAQSFLIEEDGGCFITSIDVFFQTKDEVLPVSMQIRTVENGYPTNKIVPFGQKTIEPKYVNTSEDGSVATKFEFPSPIYLKQDQEYAFVLISDSSNYNVWISNIGDIASAVNSSESAGTTTNRLVSSQPYLGVMFKSQNSSTWSADQDQDITFIAYKAKFDTSGATIFLQNADLPRVDLKFDPIMLDPENNFVSYGSESSKMRVFHPTHGMAEGGKVLLDDRSDGETMSGSPTNYNTTPINLANEAGNTFTISDVEFNSYVVEANVGNSEDKVLLGNGVSAGQDMYMDTCNVDIETLILEGTSIRWQMNTPNTKSVADFSNSQVPYTYADNDYLSFINKENINFVSPRAVYSPENESAFLSNSNFPLNKSFVVRANLISSNENISPVIDTDRMQVIGVNNLVDDFETFTDSGSTMTPGTDKITIDTANTHNLYVGNWITISGATDGITGTLDDDWLLNNSHQITNIVDANTFEIYCGGSTGGTITGGAVIYPLSRKYIYLPEFESDGGTAAAKYITRKVSLDQPSVAFSCRFAGVVLPGSDVKVYYRTLSQYDSEARLDVKDFVLAEQGMFEEAAVNGDTITYVDVPDSSNLSDFRDYEVTVESAEPFIEIAIKLVMTSTNTCSPPIIKDFRLIALGT